MGKFYQAEKDRARDQAEEAYDQAWKARDQVILKYMPEIEALHKQECPDCPWDGYSIFKKGDK